MVAQEISAAISVPHGKRYGALLWATRRFRAFVESRRLSRRETCGKRRRIFFATCAELDQCGTGRHRGRGASGEGLGLAIMDRLRARCASLGGKGNGLVYLTIEDSCPHALRLTESANQEKDVSDRCHDAADSLPR